jgi:hypothetical protein
MTTFPLNTPLDFVGERPLLDFAGCFFPECLETHVPAFLMKLNNVLRSNYKQNCPESIFLLDD